MSTVVNNLVRFVATKPVRELYNRMGVVSNNKKAKIIADATKKAIEENDSDQDAIKKEAAAAILKKKLPGRFVELINKVFSTEEKTKSNSAGYAKEFFTKWSLLAGKQENIFAKFVSQKFICFSFMKYI